MCDYRCMVGNSDLSHSLKQLFSELVDGANNPKGAFILNTGDDGLLKSLDRLPAADASRSVNDGATIAAHTQHVRYGLSLMNRWAAEGGNPFADTGAGFIRMRCETRTGFLSAYSSARRAPQE